MQKQISAINLKSRSRAGFTLTEMIVVIGIIGILAAILIPNVLAAVSRAQKAADAKNLQTLNEATAFYAVAQEKKLTEVFADISSDTDKMNLLVTGKYITAIPTPRQKNAAFVFEQATGQWVLSGNVIYQSDFATMDKISVLMGAWASTNGELTTTQNGESKALLTGSKAENYTIKVNATYLSGSATQSGYGIYYRATDSAQISGYCFQFDPGAGNRFTVRKVTNGSEANAFQSVAMAADFNIKTAHDIEITVTGTAHTVKVDGNTIMAFTDSTFQEGYVGLRTWNNSKVEFNSATVTKK